MAPNVARASATTVIDHLEAAVRDLDTAIDQFDAEWNVRSNHGGRRVGMGTHNALVSFGASYLELIAPDPMPPDPDTPQPFGVDDHEEPRLATWAVLPDPDAGKRSSR